MKKNKLLLIFILTGALIAAVSSAFAFNSGKVEFPNYEDEDPSTTKYYSFETDSGSASASLNRIAGDIDLGFSKPSQSYMSGSHQSLTNILDRDENPTGKAS